MKWHERMNRALAYIESSLDAHIDIEEAARMAYQSTAGFQRAFSDAAGMPVSEYIRRRRLHLAAIELKVGGRKVIDIAGKYGYDSPDSFTRAFREVYGMTPSSVRKNALELEPFPQISFFMSIKGDIAMNSITDSREIVNMYYERMPAMRLVGKRYTQMDMDEDYTYVSKWDEWFSNDWFNFLWEQGALPGQDQAVIFAIERRSDGRAHWIGVLMPQDAPVPEGFIYADFPEGVIGICWERGSVDDPAFLMDVAHFRALGRVLEGNEADMRINGDGVQWSFRRHDPVRYSARDSENKVVLDRWIYLRESDAVEQAMLSRREAELHGEGETAPEIPGICIEGDLPYSLGGQSNMLLCALSAIAAKLDGEKSFLCHETDLPCGNCGRCGEEPVIHRRHMEIYHFLATVTGIAFMTRDYNEYSAYELKAMPGVLPAMLEDRLDMAMRALGIAYMSPGKILGESEVFRLVSQSIRQGRPVLMKFGNGRTWNVVTGCGEDGKTLYGLDARGHDSAEGDEFAQGAYTDDGLFVRTDWFRRVTRAVIITGRREKAGFDELLSRIAAQMEAPDGVRCGIARMIDGVTPENAYGVAAYLKGFADYMCENRWHAGECFSISLRRMTPDTHAADIISKCASHCFAAHEACMDVLKQLGIGPQTGHKLPNIIASMMTEKPRREALKKAFERIWENDSAALGLIK